MTVTHLLTALKALAEECTRDMVLPCRSEKPGGQTSYRAPKVFLMDLPKKTDDTNLIPYIIIQVLTGQDEQKPGDDPNSQAAVRFVAAVFCDDMGEGKLNVLNIIERIRQRLLRREVIGGHFVLMDKIDWAIDPVTNGHYFFGEMLASFELPPILPDFPDFENISYKNTKWFDTLGSPGAMETPGTPGTFDPPNITDRTEELSCLRSEISE